MSYSLRLQDMLIVPVPDAVTMNPFLMNLATWATLVLELLIAILVWSRRLRKPVVIAGVALHSVILVTVAVGFFTPAMFVVYLAFLPYGTSVNLLARKANSRWPHRRRSGPG